MRRKEALTLGLKHYNTGEPCRRGHHAARFVSSGNCIECLRIFVAAWRLNNSEKLHQSVRKSAALWRQRYPDRHVHANQKRYEAKIEHYKEISKLYRYANPAKVLEFSRNRRARKKLAEGRHSHADIVWLYESQAGCCAQCKIDLALGYHVDHRIPLSKGGTNWPDNLQLLCPRCNLTKGVRVSMTMNRTRGTTEGVNDGR